MAQITVTVPDAARQRVLDAFAGLYGYQAMLADGTPNPQTKAQFAQEQFARFVREGVVAWEARQAGEAARKAAADAAQRDITVT